MKRRLRQSWPGRLLPRVGAALVLSLALCRLSTIEVLAQGGVPLPGAGQSPVPTAPTPGGGPQVSVPPGSAPLPGANPIPAPARPAALGQPQSGYQQLPLSVSDAQSRLDELKSLLPDSRPQDLQESIYQLCEWLTDIADAHNRLASSFAKGEATRREAETERQSCHRFSQLKNQAQLLKAELLIKQHRFPEALGPLVDIVVAEPRSATGQAAYKRLKEIGFAEEAPAELKADTGGEAPPSAPAKKEIAASPANRQPASDSGKAARAASAAVASPPATSANAPASQPPTVWLSGTPFGGSRAGSARGSLHKSGRH